MALYPLRRLTLPSVFEFGIAEQVISRQVEQQAESLIDILNEFIGKALGDRPSHHLVLMVDNLDRIIERYDGENQQSNYEQIIVNHSDQPRSSKFSQTSLHPPSPFTIHLYKSDCMRTRHFARTYAFCPKPRRFKPLCWSRCLILG